MKLVEGQKTGCVDIALSSVWLCWWGSSTALRM